MLSLYELENEKEIARDRIERIKVACVGDSLTGWNQRHPREWPVFTYPAAIEELSDRFGEVANFGVNEAMSNTSLGLSMSAHTYVPSAEIYVVCFGANDIGVISDIKESTRGVKENLSLAVNYLKENRKRVILMNIPPINPFHFHGEEVQKLTSKRSYLNEMLNDLSKDLGTGFVDIGAGMNHEYFRDGLHPNAKGSRFIAERVIAQIRT